MKSYLFLAKYYQIQQTHIQLSKFIRKNNRELAQLKSIQGQIHSKNLESTQFLYLFLLTKHLPKLQKYNKKLIGSFKRSLLKGQEKSLNIYIFFKKREY